MTIDTTDNGALQMWARFSRGAFGRRRDKCSISIEQIRNCHKESARKRYERVGASTFNRTYGHPLLQAIEDQEYDRCKSLIDGGVDVNVRDKENGCSGVHLAAKHDNSLILDMLLKNRADCNVQDETEQTPLHFAVMKDRICNVHILLAQDNLKINTSNKTNDTPLHVAAKEGRYEICKLLLQHKSLKVNSKNRKGMIPLHYAVQENQVKILQLLLDTGADWNIKDNFSYLPWHYAASKGYPECCEILISHGNGAAKETQLTTCLKDGTTPLMLAAKQGHHRCCRLMECQNINAQDKNGNTALHLAVINGFEGTISTLLEMGADTNTQNKKGVSPILDAGAKKKIGCLQTLLKKGANLKVFDKQGRSILHYAAEKNALETLKFLFDSEVLTEVIDKMDNTDCTALHVALKKDSIACALLLLERGASPIIECAGKMTPLHLAADKGCTSLCEVLLSKKVEVSPENESKATPLHMAALHGSVDVCQMLVRKGARLTAFDAKGRTALHVASSDGSIGAVKYLSKRGIPLRAKDDTGSCALHLAASRGCLESCKILVGSAKATCWEVDHNRMIPLDRAFRYSNSGTLKQRSINQHDLVFQYLLENLSFKEKNEELMLRIHSYMDKAIEEKRVTIIEAIINSSWWLAGISGVNGCQCRNFRKLIENYPELALKLMDRCVDHSEDPPSKVTYDFRLLEDNYWIPPESGCIAKSPFDSKSHKLMPKAVAHTEDNLEWKRDHPLTFMISHQQLKMLQHPLTNIWLQQKWKSYVHWIFLVALLSEAIFTVCLTVFMGVIHNWTQIETNCTANDSNCKFNQTEFCRLSSLLDVSSSVSNNNSVNDCFEQCNSSLHLKFGFWIALLSLTAVVIGREIYFFCRLKTQYIFYLEHQIRFFRMCFTIAIFIHTEPCGFKHMILNDINWQFGIMAMLLTWLHFINTLNQLPMLSIFMPITARFMKSFFKVLIYMCMIVFIFAFIFYLLLSNQEAFVSISEAMLKTTAWMLQDLAYDNAFIFNPLPLQYPIMIKFLYLVFVAFLVGFTVNFIITQPSNQLDTFRNQACFHRTVSRAHLFFKYDVCFPYFRRVNAMAKVTHDQAKSSDYGSLMTKLLMMDTNEEPNQLDILQNELEKQNKQIALLVNLHSEQAEEMNELMRQITILTKSLT